MAGGLHRKHSFKVPVWWRRERKMESLLWGPMLQSWRGWRGRGLVSGLWRGWVSWLWRWASGPGRGRGRRWAKVLSTIPMAGVWRRWRLWQRCLRRRVSVICDTVPAERHSHIQYDHCDRATQKCLTLTAPKITRTLTPYCTRDTVPHWIRCL